MMVREDGEPCRQHRRKSNGEEYIVMGFDFGMSFIGIAIGQTITKTASPQKVLKVTEGKPNWDDIAALIQKWQPFAFIVGMPRTPDGKLNWLSERANKFGKGLHGRFGKPVYYHDEELTTWQAKNTHKGTSGRKDAFAAALILEDWMSDN